jgi:hypothetical protein
MQTLEQQHNRKRLCTCCQYTQATIDTDDELSTALLQSPACLLVLNLL